jgi:hypothetical protein
MMKRIADHAMNEFPPVSSSPAVVRPTGD